MEKSKIIKAVIYLLGAIGTAIGILFGMSSCNVTRTITNSAESYSRGDTAVTIVTKTIESYNAVKH